MPRSLCLSAMTLAVLASVVIPVRSEPVLEPAPSATPVSEPAKAELVPPVPIPAKSQETPAQPQSAPAAPPAEMVNPAAAPKPVETPKPVAAQETDDSKLKKSVGCVAQLDELIKFHNKEISSLNKMISRWNARLQGYVDRQNALDEETAFLTKEMQEKQAADPKRNKKEIARLSKQIERLGKDRAGIGKDLKKQCGELAGELKEMSRETASALRERYQQVQKTIETH